MVLGLAAAGASGGGSIILNPAVEGPFSPENHTFSGT
jgi:hypothetical protein